MKLVFTKSTLPLSVLIRWGLREPVSHFAMVFKDNLLFQSNLLGTSLNYFPYFCTHTDVVYSIEVELSVAVEEKVYNYVMTKFSGKIYDWPGFFYFFWRAILFKFLGKPMPLKNPCAQPDTFLCSGLFRSLDADGVPEWVRDVVRGIPDTEMISPFTLYNILIKAKP